MRVSGVGGELRHGYQCAMRLGAWVIESVDRVGYVLEAQELERNEVWLAHRPLDLVLTLGPVEWTWRAVMPEIGQDGVGLALDRRPDAVAARAGL